MADYQDLQRIYRGVNNKGFKSSAKDELAKFVEQRFYAMSIAKQHMREVWQGTEDLYYCNDWEWILKGEGFDRPVRFPTLRDVTKSLVDVFLQNPPDILLKPRKFNDVESQNLIVGKKAYIDQRRNSIHEKTVRRQVVEDMFFFGKGFREVSYFNIEKDVDGETETIFDDVATIRHDPRHVFIDENCVKLHGKLSDAGARDIIIRRIMPYSTFLDKYKDKEGYQNIDAVIPENFYTTYGLDYTVTNSKEVIEKSPVWVVKLYEYMNQELNLYACVASGATIYESTLKKAKGTSRIPAVDYNFEPRNDSVWGNNLAQIIAPHIWADDTVFNLDLMNYKLTAQPIIAISGQFGYNPATHFMQPGGVWEAGGEMDGKLADNIQPLIAGNPNAKSTEMQQKIASKLSQSTQSDLQSQQYVPDKTATQVLRQNQMMNAHNETVECIAEIESEAVLFELFLEIMKTYLTAQNENGATRKVNIMDYTINKRDASSPEFIKKSGNEDAFELSQQMINEEADVEVRDKRAQIAQNIEKMGRMMQVIPMMGNIAQLDPSVMQKVDFVGILQQVVEAVGMDLEKSFKDMENIYDEFEACKQEILLGNNVGVPDDEDRPDSLSRFKYFMNFEKDYGEKLSAIQKKALGFHLDATLKNILRNHLDDQRAKNAAPQPGQPSTAMGQAQQVQQQNEKQVQIHQPDASLLNVKGNAMGNQLQ